MKRNEIDKKYTWDKTQLIKNEEEFLIMLEKVKCGIAKVEKFKGKLNTAEVILKFFKKLDENDLALEKLFAYAHMWLDEDMACGDAHELSGKMQKLGVEYGELSAFADVEITALSEEFLLELSEMPEFAPYDRMLQSYIQEKKHILSESEEKIMAGLGEIFSGYSEIFNLTNNADITFEDMQVDGEAKPLNHSTYALYLASENREIRKQAYEKYYESFHKNLNHITGTYSGSVKKDCFVAKTRKFDSALDMSLFFEKVDKKVYNKLLENIKKNVGIMHDYISLRKRVLGLDEICFYDLYVSMVEGTQLELEYEDACALVKSALAPLGKEYTDLLSEGFENRWIDVFYSEGKRSGAYSLGTYDCHPFVLLNYEKTTHDVFTIAHEMGHALHSHYSSKNQPISKASYKIFVAEVASTVNEVLLLRHLIDNTEDVNFKKFCLNYFLDMIRTTIFRQTMFAQFEAKAHEMCEDGEILTKEALSFEYECLGRKYYGEEITHDDNIMIEWCRIPHFYRSFYVYKYATGLISAISIAYGILENGETAVDAYKEFLKSGCSDTPTNLLKIAGVDLETDAPFEKAMQVAKNTLAELESLIVG
ncbi:MAG: oligoendopeptidase F [Bacillota bacterium]